MAGDPLDSATLPRRIARGLFVVASGITGAVMGYGAYGMMIYDSAYVWGFWSGLVSGVFVGLSYNASMKRRAAALSREAVREAAVEFRQSGLREGIVCGLVSAACVHVPPALFNHPGASILVPGMVCGAIAGAVFGTIGTSLFTVVQRQERESAAKCEYSETEG